MSHKIAATFHPGERPTRGTIHATLPYTESFGPTIQGEGPATGRAADFLRFGGCNLSCSWCDSAFTWDASNYNLKEEITNLTVGEILDRSPATAPLMVVTGGEPLLNQYKPAFTYLLELIKRRGQAVHIETNGTLAPALGILPHVDTFVVSPKLDHAGEHKRSQNPALSPAWRQLHEVADCHLKVVVKTAWDVAEAAAIADAARWPLEKVWVMPEGTTKEALAARWPMVCEEAARHGINASHRLHVLAWDDARGH